MTAPLGEQDGANLGGIENKVKIISIKALLWRNALYLPSCAKVRNAHIYAHSEMDVPVLETNRNKVTSRLQREGWIGRHGGEHDVYKHPQKPGRIIVPRHRTLSPGVARAIAKAAGWKD